VRFFVGNLHDERVRVNLSCSEKKRKRKRTTKRTKKITKTRTRTKKRTGKRKGKTKSERKSAHERKRRYICTTPWSYKGMKHHINKIYKHLIISLI
tara:strand:+ start:239 stop:526 length:288 start_codon:yes stop_codon:yes gene_type:complete